MSSLLDRIRVWIDGDTPDPMVKIAENPPPGSPAMKFIIRIVEQIKADLVSGQYIPSTDNSAAYFPPVYSVFLSGSDMKDWEGTRLEHLQSRVAEGVMRKIAELDRGNTTQTIRIEVRPDGTLNPGQIRVQSLDEYESTGEEGDTPTDRETLYRLEVKRNGKRVAIHNIKNEGVTIGRAKEADIRLTGDTRIGRIHAKLVFKRPTLSVIAKNENPTRVEESLLRDGAGIVVPISSVIGIYEYELRRLSD